MRKSVKMLPALCPAKRCCICDLQLFAAEAAPAASAAAPDGGAAGAAGAETSGTAAAESTDPGEKLSRLARRQALASGQHLRTEDPLAKVVYGRQDPAGQDAAAPPQPGASRAPAAAEKALSAGPDKNAAFERLIRGEYKEQFAARTQSIINQRFRESKTQAARSERESGLLGRIAARWGVPAGDLDALEQALQAQDGPGGAAGAEKAGPGASDAARPDGRALQNAAKAQPGADKDSPAQPAPAAENAENPENSPENSEERLHMLESENARLRGAQQRRAAEDAAEAICRGWQQDGDALRETYPSFALEAEVKNPDFARLLKAGVSVRTAYESCHLQELLGGAMQYTADKVAEGMAARMDARARRPAENGMNGGAGAVFKTDVGSLSRADREEIERRVQHGEKIRF